MRSWVDGRAPQPSARSLRRLIQLGRRATIASRGPGRQIDWAVLRLSQSVGTVVLRFRRISCVWLHSQIVIWSSKTSSSFYFRAACAWCPQKSLRTASSEETAHGVLRRDCAWRPRKRLRMASFEETARGVLRRACAKSLHLWIREGERALSLSRAKLRSPLSRAQARGKHISRILRTGSPLESWKTRSRSKEKRRPKTQKLTEQAHAIYQHARSAQRFRSPLGKDKGRSRSRTGLKRQSKLGTHLECGGILASLKSTC